jgi:hypothetical protein
MKLKEIKKEYKEVIQSTLYANDEELIDDNENENEQEIDSLTNFDLAYHGLDPSEISLHKTSLLTICKARLF